MCCFGYVFLVNNGEANPKIILFVDEVHSLLQSGIHQRGPFTDANESFKQVLGRGDVSFIGATTTAEYRHHIAPDGALARRFGLLKIDPPSPEATHSRPPARTGPCCGWMPSWRRGRSVV